MHIVQCRKCLKTATIADPPPGPFQDGVDVHAAVDEAGCVCCPLDHHHGRAAEDGVPCRPLVITLIGAVA
jgi:hypothetical protein